MTQWKNYLRIKEAGEFLGISEPTLRNWDKKGKLSSHRHPDNNYRFYRIAELEIFREKKQKKYTQPDSGTTASLREQLFPGCAVPRQKIRR